MSMSKGFTSALSLLSEDISPAVTALPSEMQSDINEIRLKVGYTVTVVIGSNLYPLNGCKIKKEHIETVISKAFRNSIHNNMDKFRSGYITYDNGCRVGFCGTSYGTDMTETIRDISSVNIRVPREVVGCAAELYDKCFSQCPSSLILFGPPSSGKTTYLRDLARLCGNRYKVSLIDERGEIAASSCGHAGCDVGRFTDVFNGYPRHEAIITAVRVMSPHMLICDETGTAEDTEALEYAVASGVKPVISCHCSSFEDLNSKKHLRSLLDRGAFDHAASLREHTLTGIYPLAARSC